MPFIDYPPHELMPHKLSKEETLNPHSVIYAFFDYAHLPQVREMLWEWLKITAVGNWQSLSTEERADVLYFYEQLEKLVEAAHLIHKKM